MSFERKEREVIAHMINKLPNKYSDVITVVKDMSAISLSELKSKLRAFYKRKLKGTQSAKELALFTQKYKGTCKNCDKQGLMVDVCRSKSNTAGTPKAKDDERGIKCCNCNKFANHITNLMQFGRSAGSQFAQKFRN